MDSGNVIDFPNRKIEIGDEIPRRSKPPEGPDRRVPVKAVVVTGLGVVGILAFGVHNLKVPDPLPLTGSFSTARGEHRCQTTPDESVICLNTGTVVRWVFNGFSRHFEVDSGEATFRVHSDSRPLEVGSQGLLVRDVHTQFDVYRKNGSTVVTVIEGEIKMLPRGVDSNQQPPESAWKSAPIFRRLEQVEFDGTTHTLTSRRVLTEQRLSQFMSWQIGEVDLNEMALSDALSELARYQPTEMRFTFQDRGMRQMHVGGRVESTHLGDFLDWLAQKHSIQHKLTHGSHGDAVIALTWQRNSEAHREPK